MAATAKSKYLRLPTRKARHVADLVRGKKVEAATSLLRFMPNKSAKPIAKVIKSAVSNATSKGDVDADNLFIKEIFIDPGPILKRFTSRAMGRGTRVNHRTSHITVVLGEK